MLPLAGPEHLKEEERDGMEPDLLRQLDEIGASKIREPDEETRKSILTALHLLCSSKVSRQYMRRLRAFPIIRNADNAEKSEPLKKIIYSIVSFLIRDEESGDNEDILGKSSNEAAHDPSDDLPQSSRSVSEQYDFLMKRDQIDADAESAMNSVD